MIKLKLNWFEFKKCPSSGSISNSYWALQINLTAQLWSWRLEMWPMTLPHLGRLNSSCSCWYSWSGTRTAVLGGYGTSAIHRMLVESYYFSLLFWWWFTFRSVFRRPKWWRLAEDACQNCNEKGPWNWQKIDWFPTFTNDNCGKCQYFLSNNGNLMELNHQWISKCATR